MENYNQYPEESYDDWKWRLILGKRNGSVNLSWDEIIDTLGLEDNALNMRRMVSYVGKYVDYLNSKHSLDDYSEVHEKKISKLDEKIIEAQFNKVKLQDQKRELNKSIREWARADHILAEIKKSIDNLQPLTVNVSVKKNNLDTSKEGVLLLSDWHVGMKTDNLANRFNDAVLKDRVEYLLSKTIEYGHDHNIDTINLFILGDIVNGLIHVTTRINNTENVVAQTMLASELLCQIICKLSEEFNQVNVYFARGNHERITPALKESLTAESFFDMIPWYLKARLEAIDNVMLYDNEYNDEIIVTNILGHKIIAVHGHRDKFNKISETLPQLLGIIPDYIFLGHFHSNAERESHGAEVIVNGSLCGTDDFAINIRRSSKPSQKFMIFDSNDRICTYNIRL